MNDKVDLRIIKTHTKLTNALSDMMDEMSFDDITVFNLCERAGVRRATFYKHFKDKYDFLRDVISKVIEDITVTLAKNDYNCLSPIDFWLKFVEEIIIYFDDHPIILSNLLKSENFQLMLNVISNCTQLSLAQNLSDLKNNGFNITTDINVAASFINGGIANILIQWLKEPTYSKAVLLGELRKILSKLLSKI